MNPLERSAREVLEACRGRGLTVRLREDGTPILDGPRDRVTPALLEVLRRYRGPILDVLRREAAR